MSDYQQQQLFATKAAIKAALQNGDKDFSILDYLNRMKAKIDSERLRQQQQQSGGGDDGQSGSVPHMPTSLPGGATIHPDQIIEQIKDIDQKHGGIDGGNLGVRFDEQIKEDLNKLLPYDPRPSTGSSGSGRPSDDSDADVNIGSVPSGSYGSSGPSGSAGSNAGSGAPYASGAGPSGGQYGGPSGLGVRPGVIPPPFVTPIGNHTGTYPPIPTLGTPASAYPSRFPGRLLSALTLYPGVRNSTFPGFPGYIRFDYPGYSTVPYTGFRCDLQAYKIGYYADVAAGCQVFHICQRDGRMDSFLCPNGTLFHQKVMTCDWWYLVNCPSSPSYYYLNGRIGVLPPLPATL
ncbi:hypothetical protein BLA29_005711, partial [Euroglyphus maynei]